MSRPRCERRRHPFPHVDRVRANHVVAGDRSISCWRSSATRESRAARCFDRPGLPRARRDRVAAPRGRYSARSSDAGTRGFQSARLGISATTSPRPDAQNAVVGDVADADRVQVPFQRDCSTSASRPRCDQRYAPAIRKHDLIGLPARALRTSETSISTPAPRDPISVVEQDSRPHVLIPMSASVCITSRHASSSFP